MFIRILAACLMLSGCSGSFNKMRSVVAEAPDWYETRRVEIRGEGYPNVAEVPVIDASDRPGAELERERIEVGAAEQAFLTHPRARAPQISPDDIMALQSELKARFGPVRTPPDILSEAEIAALRAVFDKYPAGG